MRQFEKLELVDSLLRAIGEDPEREGLRETPKRVVQSWNTLFAGYDANPAEIMKTFSDDKYDEMVVCKGIEFYSFCEHHLLPFFGVAHVAYLPDGKLLGLSKLARLVDAYARRLQIQERICEQVTSALMDHLEPRGAACVLEATHFCMVCRGVQKQGSKMITSSLKGAFRQPETRQEFFSIIK